MEILLEMIRMFPVSTAVIDWSEVWSWHWLWGFRLWLRTADECYVDDDDLTAFNGSCEFFPPKLNCWKAIKLIRCLDQDILSYCGPDSEEENITYDTNVVKYDSECRLCSVNLDCAVIHNLDPGTAITTTCWTDDGMFEEFTSYVVFYTKSLNSKNIQMEEKQGWWCGNLLGPG